jgi:membrane-anchored protein YejM (alkaline phosphatase superfamily)
MMFGAPWISVLQDNNYELGIFASSPLYSPEFDKTVFLNVSNLRFETTREGKKANTGWISDVWAVEDWLGFLDHRESSKPFFGFLFFDAVHAKDHPPGQQPFLPASKQATFVGLNNDSDPTEYRNLYNNSAHFVDGLVGQVLEDLQKRRLLENTVVVFTADHGEEFNDNKQNYWGHNGNFSDAQIQVPLSIYWPGKPGKAFSHPTTHYDVVPTLLKNIFGMKNPASDISFGSFLDDEGGRPTWHIAGSPLNFAVIEKDQMMVKFSTGYYETYDKRMKPLPDSAFRPQVVADALGRLRSYYK